MQQNAECGFDAGDCGMDVMREHLLEVCSGEKVANRDTKVWHGARENGP